MCYDQIWEHTIWCWEWLLSVLCPCAHPGSYDLPSGPRAIRWTLETLHKHHPGGMQGIWDGPCTPNTVWKHLTTRVSSDKLRSTVGRMCSKLPYSSTGNILVSVSFHQNKEDICFIVLNKKEGSGLGFSVAGGTDVQPKAIVVSDSVEMLSGQPCSSLRT